MAILTHEQAHEKWGAKNPETGTEVQEWLQDLYDNSAEHEEEMAEMLRYVYRDANGKWCASVPEYMGADKAPTTEVMEPVDYQGQTMADKLRRAYISNTKWARFLDSDGNFNLKEHWNDLYDELEKELYDDAFSILERFVDGKGRWHLGGRLQEAVSVDMEQLGLWCAHLLKRYLDPLNKDLEKANQNAKEKFLRTELFRKCPSRRQLIDTQNRIDLDSKLDGAWIATACSEPFITNPHPRRPQYSPLLELPVELHREIFNRLDRRALLSLA